MNIANKDGFRFGEEAYLIGNEYGLLCVAYGSHEQDALDAAVDAGFLDSQIMSEDDHKEYENKGWHDSFIIAGNYCKPVCSEYLHITPAANREREGCSTTISTMPIN